MSWWLSHSSKKPSSVILLAGSMEYIKDQSVVEGFVVTVKFDKYHCYFPRTYMCKKCEGERYNLGTVKILHQRKNLASQKLSINKTGLPI